MQMYTKTQKNRMRNLGGCRSSVILGGTSGQILPKSIDTADELLAPEICLRICELDFTKASQEAAVAI